MSDPVSICPEHGEYSLHTGCFKCQEKGRQGFEQEWPRTLPIVTQFFGHCDYHNFDWRNAEGECPFCRSKNAGSKMKDHASLDTLMARANEINIKPTNKPLPRRLLSTLTSAERKTYPMVTGLLDYFPDALAMVSHISYLGNEKHNKGQPLHWSRAKSGDHIDCEVRHIIERGEVDPDGILHSAEKAWRALADLQLELEKAHKLSPPRAADDTGFNPAG